MKKVIKNNYKFILGIILGLIWSMGIVYASVNGYLFESDEVSYDNTSSGLTSENVQDALDELYANSDAYLAGLNAAHPIGSIFMTVNSNYNTAAKVGTALGGTWEAIGQGRVLIGAGTGTDANSTSQTFSVNGLGGEYEHILTTSEIPAHTHGSKSLDGYFIMRGWHGGNGVIGSSGIVKSEAAYNGGNTGFGSGGNGQQKVNINATHEHDSVGEDQSHNNIQPYLVVYMYKRTA